ncbi:unnamed protein product, partial [Mesorhabditis belari]|uniref:Protein kinase domain-containing protein n=1 Tax=Mesorhabditis belari TaxID=2138241 RepID=A0AAF3EBI8_9BILA
MGNAQARKRKASDDEPERFPMAEPRQKRRRLDSEGMSDEYRSAIDNGSILSLQSIISNTNTIANDPPRKRKRLGDRLSKLFSFSTHKLDEGDQQHEEPISSASSERGMHGNRVEDGTNFASPASVSRTVWPVPWLESLFLPEFPNRNTVTERNFVRMHEIGRGSFGRVYRVVARKDSRGVYALKVMEKSKILSRNAVEQVKREVKIQKHLGAYTFVARLFFCWQNRGNLFCLQQIADGPSGDLFTVWRDHGPFPEETIRILGAEFACAIDYMHRNGIIYRDLKLENVVIDGDGHILIVDFGLAKELRMGDKTSTICGTLQYMAPEVAAGNGYGHWVDWWSLGVLLHILFTNRYPYPNADAGHHTELVFVDYSTPPAASKDLGNFLDRLLSGALTRRLCYFEVIHAHEFFSGIDFQAIEQRRFSPLAYFPWFDGCVSCVSDRESESSDADKSFESMFEEQYQDFDYFNEAMAHFAPECVPMQL